MSASPKQKEKARQEALYFCARPVCFNGNGVDDVHHINQINTDDRPENLIALCPTCHALCHRPKPPYRLSIAELRRYKRALRSFTPGRDQTLKEILDQLNIYYQGGYFLELEEKVCILSKVLLREQNVDRNALLIARLNEYRGEIAIQRGRAGSASGYLFQATETFDASGDNRRVSHCYGLLALEHAQYGLFETSLTLLDRASKAITLPGTHDEPVLYRRQGWLHHLESCVYRRLGNFNKAMRQVDLAEETYNHVETEIDDREAADKVLERAKVLIISGHRPFLYEACNLLEGVEDIVEQYGWYSAKASVPIQKFCALRALGDGSEACTELEVAWERAVIGDAGQRIRQILEILIEEPAYCSADLCERILAYHGNCRQYHGKNVKEIARCELGRMKAKSAFQP